MERVFLTPQHEQACVNRFERLGTKIGGRGRSRGLIFGLNQSCKKTAFGRSFLLPMLASLMCC
jgi:hypothetical protein